MLVYVSAWSFFLTYDVGHVQEHGKRHLPGGRIEDDFKTSIFRPRVLVPGRRNKHQYKWPRCVCVCVRGGGGGGPCVLCHV